MKTGTLSRTHTHTLLHSTFSMLTTKEFNFHSCHKTATGIQLKRHLRSIVHFISRIIAAKLFIFSILFSLYFICLMADKWQTWEEENIFFRNKQHSTTTYLFLSHAIEMRTEKGNVITRIFMHSLVPMALLRQIENILYYL